MHCLKLPCLINGRFGSAAALQDSIIPATAIEWQNGLSGALSDMDCGLAGLGRPWP